MTGRKAAETSMKRVTARDRVLRVQPRSSTIGFNISPIENRPPLFNSSTTKAVTSTRRAGLRESMLTLN